MFTASAALPSLLVQHNRECGRTYAERCVGNLLPPSFFSNIGLQTFHGALFDLPLQARKLESELDMKLAAYAKLCSGFESGYGAKGESGLATEQVSIFHAETSPTENLVFVCPTACT